MLLKLARLLLLLGMPTLALAQGGQTAGVGGASNAQPGAPAGVCNDFQLYTNTTTGFLYTCKNTAGSRAWFLSGGGAGIGGSIASTQVPFGSGVNTVTGEAAFIYATATNTLSVTSAAAGVASFMAQDTDNFGSESVIDTFVTAGYNLTLRNTARANANIYGYLNIHATGYVDIFATDNNTTHFPGIRINPAYASAGGVQILGGPLVLPGSGDGGLQIQAACIDSAGNAACGSAVKGFIVVDAGDTDTVVSTTVVNGGTGTSHIDIHFDSSLGGILGITCNTTVSPPTVTARVALTSFTVTVPAAPAVEKACYSWVLTN